MSINKLTTAVRAPLKTIIIEERNEYPDERITLDSGDLVNTDTVTVSVSVKNSKGAVKFDPKVVTYKFAGAVPVDKEILGAISISFVESTKPGKEEAVKTPDMEIEE